VTFKEVLAQVIDWLQQDKRLSYRALKRQFALDDAYLDDLKAELIEVRHVAVEEDGRILVWTGETGTTAPATAAPTETSVPTPLTYTPPYLAEKILMSRSALEGERKQVTVLFADLKGSTELIAGLDPEDARKLLDPALHVMIDAVHRFEGTVNQVLGDGIMALFGAPVAHEDHAVRACYAALAMQAAMRRYAAEVRRSHGLEVQMRVGLNSGAVVVRAIGNDLHMDYSAIGQTTHLAARMEQLATPGSIRLPAATLRLAEGLVQVIALGQFPVKGLPEPVEVFELVGASAVRRRLQASAARGLTRFVGRQPELAALQQMLAQAGAGHGQVVAVVGEAGVGKSRLVYEFVHANPPAGWLVLESASVSYGKATPYFPVIDLLKRYAHIDAHDDTRTIRAKVTGQVVTLDETLQDVIPALLALLDALPEDSPFAQLEPPQRRQRTLEALKRVLLRESQIQPLLLVFEDLHWIDSETQALLGSLVESLPPARLLLLVNYRPEYQHAWGSKTYYTQLRLDPLPPVSAHALLQALLGDGPGLEPLTHLLIARTEGNPFFLEESVRTLVETGVLVGEPGTYRLVQACDSLQVPVTVQAVLAARIDRLPAEEKSLLQTAAVIGTEVPLPLLQAIADLPEAALHSGLAHLQVAEFLYETHLFPEQEYTFKHALTHEVAYGSLLQARRQALHARIVEALETLAGDRLADQVEQCAHHAFRGEVWGKALRYGRQAGEKAWERSAYREALAALEQALGAFRQLPETRDTREQAIDLLLVLREVRGALGGPPEPRLQYLEEAATLAEALDDALRLGRVFRAMAFHFATYGPHDRAIASGQRALALAAGNGDINTYVHAHIGLAQVYFFRGDYRQAMDSCRQAMTALEGEQRYELLGRGVLSSVFSRTYLCYSLAEVGGFAEGIAVGAEGLQLAEAVNHPRSLVAAYRGLGCLYVRQGELPQAVSVLERALGLCQEVELLWEIPIIADFLGPAYVLSGRVDEAVRLLERTLEQTTQSGRTQLPRRLLPLSEVYLSTGRIEEAKTLADRALEHAHSHEERGYEAHALRLLGDIARHRHSSEVAQAQASYRQALALAEPLGMRPLQTHCHRSLGTLYAMTGQREQARAELSTAIDMYRAMAMTFWLPETEAALAQVEGR
jgi:class 3 adenylate cyclase/tetratricopeptide (TPR) repeat protein